MNYKKNVSISTDTLNEMKDHGIEPEQRMVLSVEFPNGMAMDFCMEAEAYDKIYLVTCYLRTYEDKDGYFQIFTKKEFRYDNVDFDVIYASWVLEFQDDTYVLNITEGTQKETITCVYNYCYNCKNSDLFFSDSSDTVEYDSDAERARKKALAEEKTFWEDKSYLPDKDCLTFGINNLLENIKL